jgi:hypothetical protein
MLEMSDDHPRRLRFSLSTLLLLVAIFGLSVALIISQIRISRLEREAATGRPLAFEEVARQFEQQKSTNGVTVKVTDVRYSAKEDVYRVSFSWIDPKTRQNWSTETRLKSDGFGRYYGTIESDPYKQSIGLPTTNVVAVIVETPSPLKQ